MEKTDKPFGEALRDLMDEREMSGRELAKQAGLNPGGAGVSHMLKGFIHPAHETVENLARVLGVAPSYFAEHRLEEIRRAIDWRAPRDERPQALARQVKRALKAARSLGLDV